jgi:hypothetical protein
VIKPKTGTSGGSKGWSGLRDWLNPFKRSTPPGTPPAMPKGQGQSSSGGKKSTFGYRVTKAIRKGKKFMTRIKFKKINSTTYDFNGNIIDITKCPITIPANANVIPQVKTGYLQARFTWTDAGFKYEARWHTATPGSPKGTPNNWVVTRTTPGTGTGQMKTQHILTGKNSWTTMQDWQNAILAYQNGTATPDQKQILKEGHWPDN